MTVLERGGQGERASIRLAVVGERHAQGHPRWYVAGKLFGRRERQSRLLSRPGADGPPAVRRESCTVEDTEAGEFLDGGDDPATLVGPSAEPITELVVDRVVDDPLSEVLVNFRPGR